jgi:O-antigen biosynthesis protein
MYQFATFFQRLISSFMPRPQAIKAPKFTQGWYSRLRRLVCYIRKGRSGLFRPARDYSFVTSKPVGQPITPGDVREKTVNWVVPFFDKGSGGHTTIFRMMKRLEEEGFETRIIVDDGHFFGSTEHFASLIADHYASLSALVFTDIRKAPPACITVATGWTTAYSVRNFISTIHKVYFVQDYEPMFKCPGSEYALAEETYRMGFIGITAGSWLQRKLALEFGMETHSFGFSYDRNIYSPPVTRPKTANTLFFYARPATARRAFELGILVLQEVLRRRPGTNVVLAGGDLSKYEIPFLHRSEGVVSIQRLAHLYRESDVVLVFSMTNASLIPLECMACGAVVVSNDGPSVEWLLNREVAMLTPPSVVGTANAVCKVLDDTTLRERLRDAGIRFAEASSWETEAASVAAVFEELSSRATRSSDPAANLPLD